MAVSIVPPNWQEWHDDWMRRLSIAAEGGWESCAMHWHPEEDDDRPAP